MLQFRKEKATKGPATVNLQPSNQDPADIVCKLRIIADLMLEKGMPGGLYQPLIDAAEILEEQTIK